MCGIFGALSLDGSELKIGEAASAASLAALAHRGPDSGSVVRTDTLLLGHTRLALVDLDPRSDQPFWDESRRYCLIYNGEIYNFHELRADLEKRGVRFRTESDTEVVLQALIHTNDPANAIRSFAGMFAFCFRDMQTGRTILARDRFGMKPMNIAMRGPRFYFASEVKALREILPLRPDLLTVSAYLLGHGGPMRGPSFYEGIEVLEPGCMIEVSEGGAVETRPFFRLTDFLDRNRHAALDGMTPGQIVDLVDERLWAGVESHLFADARVGAFCSGGVDSSLLVAMAARQQKEVALFHANVRGTWSEYHAAKALADHLKLDLHTVQVEEQDFVDQMPAVMRHYETPFSYHPNCPPMMMVAKLARDTGVKGLLSGEGSDELFLGYPWLGRKRITDRWDAIRVGMARMVRRVPAVGTILLPDPHGNAGPVRDLLSCLEMAEDRAAVRAALKGTPMEKDPTIAWSLDYMHHHLRTLLHRNDTMGMSGSIEARFPFLDNALVGDAVNLPGRFKLRRSPTVWEKAHPFMREKWAVREVARRYMPPELSQRIKIGFWTTVFKRIDIAPGYFAGSKVGDLLRLTNRQLTDFVAEAPADLQLRLLHTDVWYRGCIDNETDESQTRRLRDAITIRPE